MYRYTHNDIRHNLQEQVNVALYICVNTCLIGEACLRLFMHVCVCMCVCVVCVLGVEGSMSF